MTDYHLHLIISEELMNTLRRAARRRGISVPELVTEALEEKAAIAKSPLRQPRRFWTETTEDSPFCH